MKNIKYFIALIFMQFCFSAFSMHTGVGIASQRSLSTRGSLILQMSPEDRQRANASFVRLPLEQRANLTEVDIHFILKEAEALDVWQIRDVLIPIVDPHGSHSNWKFLKAVKDFATIAMNTSDLGASVLPSLLAAFSDMISQNANNTIMTCVGVGKLVLNLLKSKAEASVKEESRKSFFRAIHSRQIIK